MYILLVAKYPPIQGGVSANCYWLAQALTELGHRVTVLTNAEEVESNYRINLHDDDRRLLSGFRKSNSVRVVSTVKDPKHHFTPQTNPYVSKLVSLGLDIIADEKPDLIWAHYVEPYGIVALMLSKLTGIPYLIRHAGSDLGKLGLTEQLRSIHQEVYRQALVVVAMPKHHEYFKSIGVVNTNLVKCGFKHLPGDLFHPAPINQRTETTNILVYGKTGANKGTPQLIQAIKLLKEEHFSLRLTAYWGGKNVTQAIDQVAKIGVEKQFDIHSFIPHWRIPDAIRRADAVLFLENNFSIKIHSPGIPLEVLSCGRLLVTTEEIANKSSGLISAKNSVVLKGQDLQPRVIADAIKTIPEKLKGINVEDFFDASLVYAHGMKNLDEFLLVVGNRL